MNFSRPFAPETAAVLAALALVAGCGDKDGSASYAEGRSAFAVRDFNRAVRAFAKSASLAPRNADAWVMLARAQMALGDIPAAGKSVREAAKLAGGDADVVELAGQVAYHAKDYSETRAAYTMLTAADRPAAVRSRGYAGLAVLDMAGIAGSAADENRARARVHLLEALRLDGGNAAARYHLGRLYRDSFDYKEAALDQFGLFVHLEREDAKRVQLVQRRDIPGLKEAIARAAAEFPGADRRDSAASASALKRAEDAWRRGEYKTAKLRYNDACVADVLSFPAALGLARSWEKTDPSRAGQREALKHYRHAAQLRPSSRDTLMTVGDLAMKTGSVATAVEAYSRALAARPGDVSAIDGLIRALRKAGDAKSAAVYQDYRNGLPKRTR